MGKFIIEVLVARAKDTGEVVAVQGIDDMETLSEMIVNRKHITDREFDSFPFWNPKGELVSLGEYEAKDYPDTEKLQIEIEQLDITDLLNQKCS